MRTEECALLALVAEAAFGKSCGDGKILSTDVAEKIFAEARQQTVFSLIFTAAKKRAEISPSDESYFWRVISKNTFVEAAHYALDSLLSSHGVSYVILKGMASARFYPDPALRSLGDVDFLVDQKDFSRADALLRANGYLLQEGESDIHNTYAKKIGASTVTFEMHRETNGIPSGAAGDRLRGYFSDVCECAELVKTDNGEYRSPSLFHHGLILLLHTAAHITSEGIGLRHLCDWAVFVSSMEDAEFVRTFEAPLREVGLWRFAQLLTATSVKHLGLRSVLWADIGEDDLLDAIIEDILVGGNFGQKDEERYRQIKYISQRNEKKVGKRSALGQALRSINDKAKNECGFVKKARWLLPIGWLMVIVRYLGLVISGKRRIDTAATVRGAEMRREIYRSFLLFETE